MNQNLSQKLLTLLLAVVLCFCAISPIHCFAAENNPVCLTEDGAAFGPLLDSNNNGDSLHADSLYAWVNRSVSANELRSLLDQQSLYPQRTGWLELDLLIESILNGAGESADTYTKLRYAYDYLVKEVTYSWEGYSYRSASVKAYNSVTGYDYLSSMTYEDGLQKSIPDDMANRTYHILKYKKGVCYDYAIAMAVIARYIGIESYVETGLFIFEDTSNGAGHHGWTLLELGGNTYVFDPQRDARNYQYYRREGYYFGIPYATATANNYRPNYYSSDTTANAERKASMLPVTADRAHKVTISVEASTGGTVTGTGGHITGTTATLTAIPQNGYTFLGWYDTTDQLLCQELSYSIPVTDDLTLQAKFARLFTIEALASRSGAAQGSGTYTKDSVVTLSAASSEAAFLGWYLENGTLVSDAAEYTFTAEKNLTLIAMFEGDVFYDLPAGRYYTDLTIEAQARGIINGMTSIQFAPDIPFTRAMLVKILANLEQADTAAAAPAPFEDVPERLWYYDEINWAYETGIVQGMDDTHFAPDAAVTREQVLTMVIRYLDYKGIALEEQELAYTDANLISNFALSSVKKAENIGLIEGYEDGSFQPQNELPRREGVTILMRLVHYLDELHTEEDTTVPEDADENAAPSENESEDAPENSGASEDSSEDTTTSPDDDDAVG